MVTSQTAGKRLEVVPAVQPIQREDAVNVHICSGVAHCAIGSSRGNESAAIRVDEACVCQSGSAGYTSCLHFA